MTNLNVVDWSTILEEFSGTSDGASIGRLGGSDFEALAYARLRRHEPLKFLSHAFHSRGVLANHMSRTMQLNGFFVKNPNNRSGEFASYLDELERSSQAVRFTFYAGKSLIDSVDAGISYWAGKAIMKLSSGRPTTSYDVVENAAPFLESIRTTFAGKRLLVVSPFSSSIESQKLRSLETVRGFKWPDYELVTVTTPVTYSSLRSKLERKHTWVEQLAHLTSEVLSTDFDLALLACGSYANPLAAAIQQQGKKSIYIGGMLNVFYALEGGRFIQPRYRNQVNLQSQIQPFEARDITESVQGAGYSRRYEAIRAYLPDESETK